MSNVDSVTFQSISESCLLISFGEKISEENLSKVINATAKIQKIKDLHLLDVVPAYTTIAVFYDPLIVTSAQVEDSIRVQIIASEISPAKGRTWEIPVCYDSTLGWDLIEVAQKVGLSPEQLIQAHAGKTYKVYMRGFLPGFLYLGILDEILHLPRKAVPRTKVPAGAVAIGGNQTGLYSLESPGGWHILGQTPLDLMASSASEGTEILPGDSITFVPISKEEFKQIKKSSRQHEE